MSDFRSEQYGMGRRGRGWDEARERGFDFDRGRSERDYLSERESGRDFTRDLARAFRGGNRDQSYMEMRTPGRHGRRYIAELHEAPNGSGGGGVGIAPVIGAAAVAFIAGVAANGARKLAVEAVASGGKDWFDTLTREHRTVEHLFEQIQDSTARDGAKRAMLLSKLNWALSKHAFEEETVIYPELRMHDDGARAKQLYNDHAEMKVLLHELEVFPKQSDQWMAKMRELQQMVLQHMREEEEDIYPHFQQKLSESQNRKLTMMLHKQGMKLA